MDEQKINKIKVGTQVYALESSNTGNYLPLSGGTLTGNLNIATVSDPQLSIGSSFIKYNSTTGCLEIQA